MEAKDNLGAGEQIKRLRDFFSAIYIGELMEAARIGRKSITLSFSKLSEYDPGIAELLLDQPEEVLKAAEIGIEELDLPEHKKFQIRISDLPKTQKLMIRDIRSQHLGKLLFIEGIVRNKSDVRPQTTLMRFECPACGSVIPVPQLDSKIREPSSCSCGRKGKFRTLGKELIDAQGLVLEESPHELEGGEQPKRMNIFLKDDLVSPMADKRTNPGTLIKIVGILKEVPIPAKDGGRLTRSDLMIDAAHVEAMGEDFEELAVTEDELKQINELSNDPRIIDRLAASIAPRIYGHEKIKEALVLQLMGGVRKKGPDGVANRGDCHILLIGDPGSGKSQLLKRIAALAPKSRYVAGKGSSGTGLTAAVVKDEFLKGWTLEAGALVLANKGIACLDELDKMDKEDTSAMHEALEQQTVSINKANISATLRAETTVLAAANPKMGRFDPYGSITEQINMPITLINRFDLIFPIKDLPDPVKDSELSKFILGIHQNKIKEAEISTNLFRKYVSIAKKVSPTLTDEAIEELDQYFLKMRASGRGEAGFRSITISARQLEALIRLSEAAARARLSDKVTKRDAKRAIDLLHYCLSLVGTDPETGQIDIDKISIGVTSSQRNKIHIVKDIVRELHSTQFANSPVPIDALVKAAETKGIDMDAFERIIQILKSNGDVMEPRNGYIQPI